MRASSVAVAIALVGAAIGCDGARTRKTMSPRPVEKQDAGVGVGTGSATSEEAPASSLANLEAPAGALDALFASLDATERGDPNGRTLLLFFGDSHTAGDSMT